MSGKVVDVTLKLIDKMTSPLNAIGSKLKDSSRQWMKAGRQIQNTGKSIENVGKGLTTSLTVPIVGAGSACVKLASDFQSGMSKVQSISGATESEMEKLSAKAKEMGAKTKFSATESADAFSYMAMAGWKTADMLDGIEGIMNLAGATGEDLATTSDIVTDALTAFGMGASETNRFVDVLAATSSNANTNVALLGESFKYVAPVAGSLGYNVEDVSVALGMMANAGIKASNSGTALRSWLTRMAKPTKESQTAMTKLGLSMVDSQGNMKDMNTIIQETRKAFAGLSEAEKAEYAAMLAGKTGMSGLLAVVNGSDSDFNKLSKAIQESNNACQTMYKTANNNLKGQLTVLKSTVESLAIAFGERLTPYVTKGVEYVQKLADKFNSLSDSQKDTIIKIAAIAAAVGPALLIFGKMVTTVGKVVSVVGKVGKAIKTAGSLIGLITSPAGIVVIVIGAIVAATILMIKNWDKVKEVAGNVFGYVKNVFNSMGISGQSMFEKLNPIKDKFNEIRDKAVELWTICEPTFKKIAAVVTDVFKVRIGMAVGIATGLFSNMIDTITKWLNGFMKALSGLITFLSGVFTGNWKKAWSGIKDIFGGIFQSLVALAKAPINGVISVINGAIAGINNVGVKIPDWVPGMGGKDFSIKIPKIPTLAVGTDNWKGGIVQISERGGEIVDLPSGSRVYPHDKSIQKAYADGAKSNGKVTINIPKLADKIVIREDADIDKLVEKLADKLEKVALNLGGEELEYLT